MISIIEELSSVDFKELERYRISDRIASILKNNGFDVVEIDNVRPWGQFFRIRNEQAPKFTEDFFPDVRIEHRDLPHTPKILLHYPMQRNSWQYHNRRKEYWRFLTDGFYYRSPGNELPKVPTKSSSGDIIIFEPEERHRLSGQFNAPTLVAEIWEHTAQIPSDEDDIVRLSDDYKLNGRKVGK